MATEDSITKNDVVVASDHIPVSKDVETKEATNNVVTSDNNHTSEKETGIVFDNISMEKLNLGPKKKLLVLPITGFLVHRIHRSRPYAISKNREPNFCSGNFMIYKRPHCEEFLKFCFERFEVGIWSSAMEHNIDGVLTNVMGELKSKLLFIWDQKESTVTNFMCLDNKSKPVFLKDLNRIWNNKYKEYNSTNTLLITDPVKALLNPPNTSISPGNYDPENKEDDLLGPKGDFRLFMEGVAEAKDVQSYVKAHPIGDPAITPSHPDWDYYSKIIRSFGKKESSDH